MDNHVFSPASQSSLAVRELLKEAREDDAHLSPCTLDEGNCPLAPGIEHVFVSETACHAYRAVQEIIPDAQYHNVVYSPWTNIEPKCGFDLSIGHYERPSRLRLMHKIITCSTTGAKWCDEDWSWVSTAEKRNPRHMQKLLSVYNWKPIYQPYIALHVCYCIHEYRRMGRVDAQGRQIPGFCDPRRTVIIDLREIAKLDGFADRVLKKQLAVSVTHDPAAGKPVATLVGAREGEPRTLRVLDMSSFLNDVREAVANTF